MQMTDQHLAAQAEFYDDVFTGARHLIRARWDEEIEPLRYPQLEAYVYQRAVCYLLAGKALDIGSGGGRVAGLFAPEDNGMLIGLDISHRALQAAVQAHPRRLRGVNADAHRLPFAAETFDSAIFYGVLHHLDEGQALNEVERVVHPGGSVLFLEPMMGEPLRRLMYGVVKRANTLVMRRALALFGYDADQIAISPGEQAFEYRQFRRLIEHRFEVVEWLPFDMYETTFGNLIALVRWRLLKRLLLFFYRYYCLLEDALLTRIPVPGGLCSVVFVVAKRRPAAPSVICRTIES